MVKPWNLRMYVYNDKIVISCNYKDGTKTINFSEMECALNQRASASGSDLDCSGAPAKSPKSKDLGLFSNFLRQFSKH